MDGTKREWLKQQHRFSEWAGRGALPQGRRAEPPALTGKELPGWTLERTDQHKTFWRRGGAGGRTSDAVVRVDIFALDSVQAAHEYLVDALGEFESSAMRRRTDANIGDVAFGTEAVMLFARGNLVVVVRNAGREIVPVTAIARAVDAVVLGRPEEVR
jgi:hypothetical protein